MTNTRAYIVAGHEGALGLVRSLGRSGVEVVNLYYSEKDIAPFSKYVTRSFKVFHPEKRKEEFVKQLITYSERFGRGVLFPASDEAIVTISKNKEVLDKHFLVASCPWVIAKKFIEKKYTYALADAHGIPAPKTITPKSLEEVDEYAQSIRFPCLVKPSQSHLFVAVFRKKMIPVNNKEELIRYYNQAKTEGLEVMLQEIIQGDDDHVVNYNAYFFEGKPLLEFTAQQIRSAPPWWGAPRVVKSEVIKDVIKPGRDILKAMNFEGYACVEFKKDGRDGIYRLVEVNGRHNLSTLLAVKCGINFPYIHYQHLVENKVPVKSEYKTGVYWVDITKDIVYSLRFLMKERYSPMKLIRPYVNPLVCAIFDWRDIKPFVKRWLFMFK